MFFVRFLDGPAEGVTLQLRRAPVFLRAVIESAGTGGEWDALDQLDDAPEPGEAVAAYRRRPGFGVVHLDRTVRGRRVGEWYHTAEYAFVPDQPDDTTARDTELWRTWCYAQVKAQSPPEAPADAGS